MEQRTEASWPLERAVIACVKESFPQMMVDLTYTKIEFRDAEGRSVRFSLDYQNGLVDRFVLYRPWMRPCQVVFRKNKEGHYNWTQFKRHFQLVLDAQKLKTGEADKKMAAALIKGLFG